MTIIDNSLTAQESILRIHNPIFYVPDPERAGPLDGFQAYFGIVGRDPILEENRKIAYALQEDGSAVPMSQPVIGSAGGVPGYNGSYVGLAISGSYSLTILNKLGEQIYYIPRVEANNLQGYSAVIAEESQAVSGGLSLTFSEIETTTASFYMSASASTSEFKGSYLKKGVDYTTPDTSTVTLTSSAPTGTVLLGRAMDPTGQIVPVTDGSSALFVFEDIASAVAANLQGGDTITINGGLIAGDKLGGNKYLTVLGQPDTEDGENIINLVNGNQIKVIENSLKLARYSEVTTDAVSVAGALNLDLNQGNVFTTTLTENISTINFLNANPDATLTTTVTLKITQDATTPYTVSFGGASWNAGVVPAMSTALDARDRFAFVTENGTDWDGSVIGQGFA